jgi:hypothetical protein
LVIPDISEREYRERAAGKNARVRRIQLEEGGKEGREVRIAVRTPPGVRGRDLVDELRRLDEVASIRWDE